MTLLEQLDLEKAFRRVDKDRRDDALPDIVGYRDYKRELEMNLEQLSKTISDPSTFQAGSPLTIDIPKRDFTLRPGIVPLINDRIIYQSIADFLAPQFSSEPYVYSNKLADPQSDRMFIQGVELWISFQNKVEELCYEFPFVVETDITAYFDHINHRLLISKIKDLFGSELDRDTLNEIITILSKLWDRWNIGYLQKFGIPQINDASAFMANIYLDELDKWLLSQQYLYLRYVDDIRIFANSEPQARSQLSNLIVKMREMGLYVATGKTKIKSSSQVLQELSQGRQQISEIEDHICSKDPERMSIAAKMIEDFFIHLVDNPEDFNDRHFRYCVNRFKRLFATGFGGDIHQRVASEILLRLKNMPDSTDIFVDYLSLFSDSSEIHNSILEFLEGPYNIYSWQEMQLMELLIRVDLNQDFRLRINQFANNVIKSGRHPACKARAYVLRGKYGSYADRRDVRSQYSIEQREDVRRAIIVAIQEMTTNERDHFYQGISEETYETNQMVSYIKSLPEPKYHYYNPPSSYEIMPWDFDSDDMYDLGSEYFV